MVAVLRQTWVDLLDRWAVDLRRSHHAFDAICLAYGDAGRAYHTLNHIRDVLTTIDRLCFEAHQPDAVRLAGWLHDVVYDSRASDNEERSAGYAEELCQQLGIPVGATVAALIRATKTHEDGGDLDAQILLDADLAILGAEEPQYWTYMQQIRQEYAWVPEAEYKVGRQRVLERFLARPRIYSRLAHLEAPARRNLAAEIESLR